MQTSRFLARLIVHSGVECRECAEVNRRSPSASFIVGCGRERCDVVVLVFVCGLRCCGGVCAFLCSRVCVLRAR